MAKSVVDGGNCDDIFSSEEIDGTYEGIIRAWTMNAKTKEDTFIFHSIELGRTGQSYSCTHKTDK